MIAPHKPDAGMVERADWAIRDAWSKGDRTPHELATAAVATLATELAALRAESARLQAEMPRVREAGRIAGLREAAEAASNAGWTRESEHEFTHGCAEDIRALIPAAPSVDADDTEARIQERRDSIRRGARRTDARFKP